MAISCRKVSTLVVNCAKTNFIKLKGRSKSSQEWLIRQMSDPYIEKAKINNYRCRSAFKLLEIDSKYKIIKPGDVVIDCGAAPGGWTQIATAKSNAREELESCAKGTVIGIDLLHIHPIPGAVLLGGLDFTSKDGQERIKSLLGGKPINCILSDMAPNATGIKSLDQEIITSLCYSVLEFATAMSAKDGNLLIKVWDNGKVSTIEKDMLKFYKFVRRVKPKASRSDSSEIFILAKHFKGLQQDSKYTPKNHENTSGS